jgi:hypothetical protein
VSEAKILRATTNQEGTTRNMIQSSGGSELHHLARYFSKGFILPRSIGLGILVVFGSL